MQLYRMPLAGGPLEQLTDGDEPVAGRFVPGGERVLAADGRRPGTSGSSSISSARPASPSRSSTIRASSTRRRASRATGACSRTSTNRRNGVDFDVVVRELESGEERIVYGLGGWCDVAGFSPDGRLLAVHAPHRALRRQRPLPRRPRDAASGSRSCRTTTSPYVGPPAWLPDGGSFLFATSAGRDTAAIARYDVAARTWEVVLESPGISRWAIDDAGTNAARRTRTRTATRGSSCATRRRSSSARGAAARAGASSPTPSSRATAACSRSTSPRRSTRATSGSTTRNGRDERLTASPSEVPRSHLVEPTLHRFESFDGESVPVFLYEHGGRLSGSGRDLDPRRARGAAAADLERAAPVLRRARVRGRGARTCAARRATGSATSTSTTSRSASTRCATSPRCTTGSGRGAGSTRRAPSLYGGSYGGYMVLAGLAFQPERWAAGVDIVGHLEPRHVPREHLGVPARVPRARVRLARARPRVCSRRSRRSRASTRSGRRSSSSTAPTIRACPLSEAKQMHAELVAARHPVRAARLRGRGPRARQAEEPPRRVPARRRVPRGRPPAPVRRERAHRPRP